MLVLIHVVIALASIASTSVVAVMPAWRRLYASYALIGLTLVSGTYLVISTHQPMLQSCVTGLVYLGVVMFGAAVAHYRLRTTATQKND